MMRLRTEVFLKGATVVRSSNSVSVNLTPAAISDCAAATSSHPSFPQCCSLWKGTISATALLVGLTVPALAQQIPPSADPGRLEHRFERPQAPQSKPKLMFPAPEQAPPPAQAEKVRFKLTSVLFEGSSVIGTEQLRPLYENLLGSDVSLLDIYKLRDAITAKLRNDGYILSAAFIPAQTVESGIVRITIVEGGINSIHFGGDAVADRFGVLERFAEKIKAAKPLRAGDLERYVLLMDDLPGIKVKTTLKPTPGTKAGSDLEVAIEHKMVGASVTIDNRGTKSIGPYQIDGSVSLNDVIGVFDQTTIRSIITPQVSELRYVDLAHTEQLDSEGTSFLMGARRSWSNPGYTLRAYDLQSKNDTLRFDLAHPFIRSRSDTLRGDIGFDYKNSRTNSLGTLLNEDRLRVLSLGVSYDFADVIQGSNLLSARFSQGLNIFHPTQSGGNNLSRAGGRSDFQKVTVSAQHNQPLPAGFGIMIGTDAQWSPRQLLSSEEFGIGGSQYARAFDSSEVTGDNGLAAKLEFSYTPSLEIPNLKYVQLYTFADGGGVQNYESDVDRHGWQTLASAGIGARVAINDTATGSFELAKPFIRDTSANGNRDMRGFFSVTARY